jgi:hypothetical protein
MYMQTYKFQREEEEKIFLLQAVEAHRVARVRSSHIT